MLIWLVIWAVASILLFVALPWAVGRAARKKNEIERAIDRMHGDMHAILSQQWSDGK